MLQNLARVFLLIYCKKTLHLLRPLDYFSVLAVGTTWAFQGDPFSKYLKDDPKTHPEPKVLCGFSKAHIVITRVVLLARGTPPHS